LPAGSVAGTESSVANGERYDLTVIGSGPGGYVAAIRAAQLGQRVAIVEADRLGGVCLNWGCIPTKALLRNAEVVTLFQRAADFGIACDGFKADFGEAVKRSRQIAGKFNKGVEFLMKKHSIRVFAGWGRLASPTQVQVLGEGGAVVETVATGRVLLATGSRPKALPGLPADGTRVLTSTEAMVLPRAPKSIVVVGAGAVGVEFADIFHAYGAEVTVVEMLPQIVPLEDPEVAQVLARSFGKRGIRVRTGAKVERAEVAPDGVRLHLGGAEAGEVRAEAALVAVGRAPNVENLGLEGIGVAIERGFIRVDERMATSVPGVYAIGYTVIYNNKRVSPKDTPKRYEDLLDPRWKGNMIMDITAHDLLAGLIDLWGEKKASAFLKKLAEEQAVRFARQSHTFMTQLVATGEHDLIVDGYIHNAVEIKSKGAPIEFVIMNPTIMRPPAIIAIASRAPHPHAAALFVDYHLSKEASEIMVKNQGRWAPRRDVKWTIEPEAELHVVSVLEWGKKNRQLVTLFNKLVGQ